MSKLRPFLLAFGSLWFGAVLLVLVSFAMAAATTYESAHGTPAAQAAFYQSTWFTALLVVFGLSALSALVVRYPYGRRDIGFLCTHGGLLVILLGALVTRHFGERGSVPIVEGQTVNEFLVEDTDALELAKGDSNVFNSVLLDGDAVTGSAIRDFASGPAVSLEGVTARVVRYLPDSEYRRVIHDDGRVPQPLIEVRLKTEDHVHDDIVMPGRPTTIDERGVSYRRIDDDAELKRLLQRGAAPPASKGDVTIKYQGGSWTFPLEQGQQAPVPLGDTGYVARVVRYLPDAKVGSSGKVENKSDRPVNPYVEVEISGKGQRELKRAFSKFPGFASMHAAGSIEGLELAFETKTWDAPVTPIEVLRGPKGSLHVRMDDGGGAIRVLPLEPKVAVAAPWKDTTFTLLASHERARAEWVLEPVTPVRKESKPGLCIDVEGPAGRESQSVQKGSTRTLQLGEGALQLSWTAERRPLGFSVKLERFHLGRYPGSNRPRSFESHVSVMEPGVGRQRSAVISMNNPGSFGDYTLYQSSYQMSQGRKVTILSVARDPGQIIVFLGYFIMMGGMLVVLGLRMADRRRADRMQAEMDAMRKASATSDEDASPTGAGKGARRALLLLLATLLLPAALAPAQQIPQGLDLDGIRSLPVQHDGRWPPLDTVARDLVLAITGDEHFGGHDPVATLLAWTFDPIPWQHVPLISVKNAELREELGLPDDQTIFAFSTLLEHPVLRPMIQRVSQIQGRKLDPLEKKVDQIHGKLLELQQVFSNEVIKPVPAADDVLAAWKPVTPRRPGSAHELHPIQDAWAALQKAFLAGDRPAFNLASRKLAEAQRALPAAHRPSPDRIQEELTYNRTRPFRRAWIIMAIGFGLTLAAMFVRRRWFDALGVVAMLIGFGTLTWGLFLRGHIAGHIPASNMFESLLFLSLGMGAFAILAMLVQRHRIVPLTASFMGALSLMLADVLPVDKFVRPTAPVLLDTVWMSIHVPIIMVSYSVLALAVLIAHAQIVAMALNPGNRRFVQLVDRLHYWYIHVGSILLTVGILTGSLWAASSWGRYWGWDPKEVWSLVALLGYMTIMHVRLDHVRQPPWIRWLALGLTLGTFAVIVPMLAPFSTLSAAALGGSVAVMLALVTLKGAFATALKSIMCFWLIIMTYVGVNYVLGIGLHSYGFGSGAVVHGMFTAGTTDLLFVGTCTLVYILRRRATPELAAAA